jgi:hypothetical protein
LPDIEVSWRMILARIPPRFVRADSCPDLPVRVMRVLSTRWLTRGGVPAATSAAPPWAC